MKISLKELRETMVWLKIIARKNFPPRHEVVRANFRGQRADSIFFRPAPLLQKSTINNRHSSIQRDWWVHAYGVRVPYPPTGVATFFAVLDVARAAKPAKEIGPSPAP
jgi:hypothetical protein